MTADANGNIGANFSGIVSAKGLDFLDSIAWTDPTQPVPPTQRITWREQNTGAFLADIYVNDVAHHGAITIESLGGNQVPGANYYDYQSSLTLQSGADDASSSISVDIETPTRSVANLLLDATGASDFMRGQILWLTASGGVTYTQTNTVLASGTAIVFGEGTTTYALVGMWGYAQHNGVNGTAYRTSFGTYVNGAFGQYLSTMYGSVNGMSLNPSGAALLNLGSSQGNAVGLAIRCTSGTNATWGLYNWGTYCILFHQ
jgi:hypothetical protein